jgi:hypothetical protein
MAKWGTLVKYGYLGSVLIASEACSYEKLGTRHQKEGVRSQESEFRRKAIKTEFSSTTGYWIL